MRKGGGDIVWRQKGTLPLEPPEPGLRLKQERFTDKPSHRLVDGAFGKLLLLLPPPHTHTHNPDTCPDPKPSCVSMAIKLIADYTHNSPARLDMNQFMKVYPPFLLKVY